MNRTLLAAGCAVLLSLPATPLDAPGVAAVIEQRQSHFDAMGRAMKSLRQTLRRGEPDWPRINAAAALIESHAGRINGWFPAGSGAESGLDTDALAYIWKTPERFASIDQRLHDAAVTLTAVAEAGDAAALPAAFRAVAGACKQCHDSYRAD